MAEEHVATAVSSRGGYGYNYTLSVGWATKEQSIANNTTRIEAYATLDGQWIGWNGGNTSIWLYWYDAYTGGNTEIAYGTWTSGGYYQGGARTVPKTDFILTHRSDGTARGHIWARIRTSNNNGYLPNDADFGGSDQTITTIPRASTYTLSSSKVELGNTVKFDISRFVDSFSHKIFYTINDTETQIAELDTSTTSYTWTVPTSLATSITTSTEVTIQTKIRTYSGDTRIGSSTQYLTLVVPSSYTPTIAGISYTDATDGNVHSTFGGYIQNKSKILYTIKSTGYSGSTIISSDVTIDGVTTHSTDFTESSGVYTTAITTPVLTASGSVPYTVSTTDSRGRTTSLSGAIPVIEYFNPKITYYKAARASKDSSGALTEDETEGVYAYLGFSFAVAPINNKNTFSFRIQYRKLGANGSVGLAWTNVLTLTSGYSTTAVYEKAGNIFSDTSDTYEVRFGIYDWFSSDYTWVGTATIPSTYTLINFGSSGKSISLFSQSSDEENTMEINGIAKLLVNDSMYSLNSIVSRFLDVEARLNKIFPVGAVYMTYNNNNPGNFLIGTWVQFGQGRTLVGVGDVSDEDSHTRTFAENEEGGKHKRYMVAAIGASNSMVQRLGYIAHPRSQYQANSGVTYSVDGSMGGSQSADKWNHSTPVTEQGADLPAKGTPYTDFMPPYITIYFWRRTA